MLHMLISADTFDFQRRLHYVEGSESCALGKDEYKWLLLFRMGNSMDILLGLDKLTLQIKQ